jgi:hypothetical protein
VGKQDPNPNVKAITLTDEDGTPYIMWRLTK